MSEASRSYPRRIECGGSQIDIARMRSSDRDALAAFVATQPPHDLLFVPRDISQPKVVDAWMRSIEAGELTSLVARDGDAVVGCTAIFTDALSWSRHVADRSGNLHDLVLLSHDVDAVAARNALYGLTEALGGDAPAG